MGNIKTDVHTCYHCGNTGVLNFIGKTGWKYEEQPAPYGPYYLIEHEDWFAFECPVCNRPVLISSYCFDAGNTDPEIKTEYPTISVSPEGVPKEIYSAFEAAVKTKGIDYSICLLSLRRVLEMICKDKGAKGDNLEKKIANLIDEKVLPPMIEDACWIIRQLGNDAAHADKMDIYTYDVEQVINYVTTIIDYLYSIPYRVEKLKHKIEKRKQKRD